MPATQIKDPQDMATVVQYGNAPVNVLSHEVTAIRKQVLRSYPQLEPRIFTASLMVFADELSWERHKADVERRMPSRTAALANALTIIRGARSIVLDLATSIGDSND